MPGIMGIVADRWIQAQKLLSLCHLMAGLFMGATGLYGMTSGCEIGILFTLYALSVAFFMPTIALCYSVAFNALSTNGYDTVKAFPPIRIWGTIGFICTMVAVDLLGFQTTSKQFLVSATLSLVLAAYSLTLPASPVNEQTDKSSSLIVRIFGLDSFKLFKKKKMAIFFVFSMFLGVCLQITNGYANPFITSFKDVAEYADTFGAQHANILISLSQISETCCILLIPFCLKKFGIKKVMMIAIFAWVLRFGLFGLGDTGSGLWMLVSSCIVYGVAFDFFNISGALFVDKNTDADTRSSAQGLFMMMTNGVGATVGTLAAGAIINSFCSWQDVEVNGVQQSFLLGDWQTCWFIFAGFALVVGVAFALVFHPEKARK